MEIINVEYHNGKVLNNTDRQLKDCLENGAKITHVTPILSVINGFVQTTSIQYIIEYSNANKSTNPPTEQDKVKYNEFINK